MFLFSPVIFQSVVTDSSCRSFEPPWAHTGPCPSRMEAPFHLGCTSTSQEEHLKINNSQVPLPEILFIGTQEVHSTVSVSSRYYKDYILSSCISVYLLILLKSRSTFFTPLLYISSIRKNQQWWRTRTLVCLVLSRTKGELKGNESCM